MRLKAVHLLRRELVAKARNQNMYLPRPVSFIYPLDKGSLIAIRQVLPPPLPLRFR